MTFSGDEFEKKFKSFVDKKIKESQNQLLVEADNLWESLKNRYNKKESFLLTPSIGIAEDNSVLLAWSKDAHYLECEIEEDEISFFYRNKSTEDVHLSELKDRLFKNISIPIEAYFQKFTKSREGR